MRYVVALNLRRHVRERISVVAGMCHGPPPLPGTSVVMPLSTKDACSRGACCMRRAARARVNIGRAAQVDRIRLNSCFRVLSRAQLTAAPLLAGPTPRNTFFSGALARASAISAMAARANELRESAVGAVRELCVRKWSNNACDKLNARYTPSYPAPRCICVFLDGPASHIRKTEKRNQPTLKAT